MFLAKLTMTTINDLSLKFLILKDDLYNDLKSKKVSWRSAKPFSKNPQGGHFAPQSK